ncbi:DNA damage-repair/toleration protein DRT102 [Macadamia integrifolia]|uniref:DNA damage-repair/toleration protein DRT102 n=1 Tax=Macadamia integrifolia TaxID=60698 RepID=UPI001C4EFDB3|nr:DNA damage-repair/toleration protein DRT102 [Macadamia integrifolia]XP_042504954.1 DNA damage-repair/toleration protein DRT102 [Macadamia integrifolia]XP_042504955.1 DNA damage-repair/toleration protein DRT102 [Macadamia integrifolia]XP_042504956.1 DNA damage-repair/toleration protein DRT102 [Macadamia integrifolia]XP_042504957.1 DNA damage-repair/toleration protein DRT102 [Macadamia integrifolia]XP_042504958.1 DNA damage-repair/toleration protein DRT102 [Macadamia integrifolia]
MSQDSSPRPLKIFAGADAFGCNLKDALVAHLRSLGIEVEDIGTGKYYSIGEEVGRRVSNAANSAGTPTTEIRGLVACGTGVGVSMFANKYPGVYASTCLTTEEARNARSISSCNVLAVSGMNTAPETGIEILKVWLETPFKSPCPASGNNPWPQDIETFLDESISEMSKIGTKEPEKQDTCAICCLAKNREFSPVEIMPGASMKIVRESPTSAIVRFKAGSVEPAHHHTFGHDLVVMKGSKRVWNLSEGEKYDLGVGDFLFTPAGDVHRVKYFEDSEFFIRWDGHWDIFLDEDLDAAKAAIEKDLNAFPV